VRAVHFVLPPPPLLPLGLRTHPRHLRRRRHVCVLLRLCSSRRSIPPTTATVSHHSHEATEHRRCGPDGVGVLAVAGAAGGEPLADGGVALLVARMLLLALACSFGRLGLQLFLAAPHLGGLAGNGGGGLFVGLALELGHMCCFLHGAMRKGGDRQRETGKRTNLSASLVLTGNGGGLARIVTCLLSLQDRPHG
jgi:hypothetical protein